MFKRLRRLFAVCLSLAVCIVILNAETDVMRSFSGYLPELCGRFPAVGESIEAFSQFISEKTNYLTVEKLIAMAKGEALPVDPDDVAVNTYYEDDKHLNFYKGDYTALMINGDRVNVFGVISDKDIKNVAVVITDAGMNDNDDNAVREIGEKERENKFSIMAKLPEDLSAGAQISVYGGKQRYGEYESIVHDYIYPQMDESGNIQLALSPVYDENKKMYERDKSVRGALKSTSQISAEDETVKQLSEKLTEGYDNDYDKLVSIHDWICENIYYDRDFLAVYNTPLADDYQYLAPDVLNKKSAVCSGFANTFAALARAAGIPCNVVLGYALGLDDETQWSEKSLSADEPNHAWNEAYADGRWIIIDTTWDCKNTIENKKMNKKNHNYIYFDANIRFFSQNHRIMEYVNE